MYVVRLQACVLTHLGCNVVLLYMSHTVRHHLVSYFIASLDEQWDYTPLLLAAVEGHADVVLFFLERSSDVLGQTNVSVLEQPYGFLHFYLY